VTPVPWGRMAHAAIAIGAPVVTGVAAGRTVYGVLASLGGFVASLADRTGPYPARVRRIASATIVGGVGGMLIGIAVNGERWLMVVVIVAVAGISALISLIGATGSAVGMFLLAYAALGSGPIGAIRPWWLAPTWMLVGIAWSLLLLLPGWLLHPRTVEEQRVAAAYRAVAAELRVLGTEMLSTSRAAVTDAMNGAYDDLVSQPAGLHGRNPSHVRLVGLVNQAREMAHASAALAYAGKPPMPEVAAQAEAVAAAVLDGHAVGRLATPPSDADPAVAALYKAVNAAAELASGRHAVAPEDGEGNSTIEDRRARVDVLLGQLRGGVTSTFTLRLMLCIGVAAAISTTLPLQRSYWVILAVAVVMKPDFGSVFARAVQYGVGTLIGALVAALILEAQPPHWAILIPLVFFGALLPYGTARQYGLFALFFTPAVILLIELISPGGWSLAQDRLVDIVLGCGIVLVIGYLPWPSSWHTNLVRRFGDVLDDAAEYTQQVLGEGVPILSSKAHADARLQLPHLGAEMQRTLAEPRRVRESVNAWSPAVAALAGLIDAITATAVTRVGEPPPPEVVNELAHSMRQLAATVRSGSRVRLNTSVSRPESLKLVSDALQNLHNMLAATPPLGSAHPHVLRGRRPDS
jgi:uncharacterized membrane protein YccC